MSGTVVTKVKPIPNVANLPLNRLFEPAGTNAELQSASPVLIHLLAEIARTPNTVIGGFDDGEEGPSPNVVPVYDKRLMNSEAGDAAPLDLRGVSIQTLVGQTGMKLRRRSVQIPAFETGGVESASVEPLASELTSTGVAAEIAPPLEILETMHSDLRRTKPTNADLDF
jgi:hypothetical protein